MPAPRGIQAGRMPALQNSAGVTGRSTSSKVENTNLSGKADISPIFEPGAQAREASTHTVCHASVSRRMRQARCPPPEVFRRAGCPPSKTAPALQGAPLLQRWGTRAQLSLALRAGTPDSQSSRDGISPVCVSRPFRPLVQQDQVGDGHGEAGHEPDEETDHPSRKSPGTLHVVKPAMP